MKKFYCLLALLLIGASINPSSLKAQLTTVFIDTFDGEFFAGPGGDPSTIMTPNAGPLGAFPISYSGVGGFDFYGNPLPPGYLTTWMNDDPSSPPYIWSQTSGGLGSYALPWAGKLNLNTGLVTWTFNMNMSTPQTGNFGVTDDEALVMLAGSDDRVFSSGTALPTQGYAVTFTSGAPYGIRLIKFAGAMSGSAPGAPAVDVITPSASFPGVAGPTQFLSVRVTYDPSTDRWNLYVRDDGAFGFSDPSTGVTTLVGTAIDNSYTGVAVTRFGFYSHFDASSATGFLAKYAFFDNYKVTVSCTMPVAGNPEVCFGGTSTLTDATPGGTWSSFSPLIASVDAAGVVSGLAVGTAIIRYELSPTCWADTLVTVHALPTITGPLTVCEGNTVTVAATPAGGTWATATTTHANIDPPTGALSGTLAGNETISYTDLNGCVNTATATVNPALSAIGGTRTVCELGGTTTLTNSTPSGTWSATANPHFSINASTGVVTGINALPAPGTATVTYTAPSGCYTTAVVTTNPLPSTITGVLAVCQGSTTTLANATAGGGTWSSAPTANGTIGASNGVAGGVTGGTMATITFISNVTGCARNGYPTVNALPPATTGTFTVRAGSTTLLSNTGTPGVWSTTPGGNASVNAGTGLVTGITAGTQRITFTKTPSGCLTTTLVTVYAVPANITGTLAVCQNSTTNLTSSPLGGTWSSSNTAIGTISASTMPGVAGGISAPGGIAGTTTISYTLSTGCAKSAVLTVNPLPGAITGINSVCVGYPSTLSSSPIGGTWASTSVVPPLKVSVVPGPAAGTGVITGLVVGTSTITYTLPTGCYTTLVATTNITPIPIITPIGDTMLCPGDFVVLAASTGTLYTYQWSDGGIPIAGATNATYTTSTPGSYDVYISNGIGCAATSPAMSVSLNPATATITPPSTGLAACAGGGVALSANTGTGLSYQWIAGTPAAPIPGATNSTYSATANGSVKVIVTNSAGCSAADSIVVTIHPLPSAGVVVSGPVNFCQGGSVILSAASVPGNTYQWFNTGAPIPGATSSSYAATTSGNYSVTIVNGSTLCSATSTAILITVYPLPNVTISHLTPTVFCPGGSVSLTAAANAVYTYQWYAGGTAIAGATNASYVATTSGGYRVKIVNTTTGCTAMTGADTAVTVLLSALVVPMTPSSFCWGGNALLSTTASNLPYVTFQWYFNGSAISGANGSTYLATVAGNYSCRITPPGGCNVNTPNLVVTEYPLPNPIITYNTTTGLMFTSNTFVTYQWYKNTVLIPGANTSTVYPSGNGDYKVVVTDANGCLGNSTIYQLKNWIGTNGVANVGGASDVRIYPNPATAMIHVEGEGVERIVVSSVDGKSLIDVNSKDINISQLADGVYMITVYNVDGQKLKVDKLVKATN